MFGESDSESPRTGSPWDTLLSEPKSPLPVDDSFAKQQANHNVPKLAPEVEQGNVEYKLKLINPTSERFARLVTQLKWRLLEGGGQAFYELGVADSGQLVGLPRLHLEQSLQTLEEMAGEIGASVIVVKEIELPQALVELADNSQTKPDGAMRMPKKRMEDAPEILTENECTNTEEETELSTPEPEEDLDEDSLKSPVSDSAKVVSSLTTRSYPDRPTAQSSPTVSPVEDDYDLLDAGDETDLSDLRSTIDLEISSVYKPRPTRRRTPEVPRQPHGKAGQSSTSPINIPTSKTENKRKQWQEEKWTKRNRKGKDWKKQAKVTEEDIPKVVVEDCNGVPCSKSGSSQIQESVAALVPSLQALHVPVEEDEVVADSTLNNSASKTTVTEEEGRFIVEVLVVKKMALEEAFLDFGGFRTR